MEKRARFQRGGLTRAVRRVGLGSIQISVRALRCKSAAAGHPPAKAPPAPAGLMDGFCPELCPEEQLAANASGRLLLLRLDDISLLEAEPDGVALRVGKQTHRVSESLDALEAKLPPGLFLRISPRASVNTRQIQRWRRLCQGEWQVQLRDGARLVSHTNIGKAVALLEAIS